jgi:DNA-binding NarL/FixJ family response regulator
VRANGSRQRPLTLSKLGVRDRTRAVLKAFELQLV